MRVSDKAIVLQAIKYGDKKFILKLFSRHHGLVTTAVAVGNSPSSKIKPGIIAPMNLLEVQFTSRQNKDVQQLTEASCYYIHDSINGSLTRLSIAQFLNEILLRTVKEQAANTDLFDFTEGCIKYLNESENEFVNLHVYFLAELTKYLGFEPNNNYSPANCYFDCREGQFVPLSLSFPLGLDREESLLFSEALKSDFLNAKFSNTQRQKLLEIFTAYYQAHVPGFTHLKSLEVLKEVVAAN